MIAVDTNVLVRYFTEDDTAQAAISQVLMRHGDGVFISKTVILELEWVLRGAFKLPKAAIAQALSSLFGLPNVTLESPSHIVQAMQNFAEGMDFADALHLASMQADEGLYTFDKKFATLGKPHGVVMASSVN